MGRVETFEVRWQQEAAAVISGMKEWRLQHPRATWREIEAALDERLSGMRARLLEDLALASAAAELSSQGQGERPTGARCGVALRPRGRQERSVLVQGGQVVRLERDYAACPSCGEGLFPPG